MAARERLCEVCIELYRGDCYHPDCPRGMTRRTDALRGNRKAATLPSVVAPGSAGPPPFDPGKKARGRRKHVGTSPSVVIPAPDPRIRHLYATAGDAEDAVRDRGEQHASHPRTDKEGEPR